MKNNRKANLLLIEILVMTLFFAISAAVCLRIFAFSFQMSSNSRNLNEASIHAQSAASCYKAAEGDMAVAAGYLSAELEGDAIRIEYDKNWEVADGSDAVFLLTMETIDGQAKITVQKSAAENPIFAITVGAV